MADSYLYLKCAQCGIEKLFYREQFETAEWQREEEVWQLKHYGHEAAVGLAAFKQSVEADLPTKQKEISDE